MFKQEYASLFTEAVIVRTDDGEYVAWQKMEEDREAPLYDFDGIVGLAREVLTEIDRDVKEDPYLEPDLRREREIITGFLKQHGAL